MLTACLAFAAAAALVTITPGLDTMLVLRATVTGGRRAGGLAAVGVASGCLCWALASAAGLTALLAASRVAFDVLRAAGACYLLWLGGRALWRARREATSAIEAPDAELSGRAALRTGFTTNLLNPKIGVFYMSLLPQFVPEGASMFWTSLLFAAIHALQGVLWFTLVVGAAGAARRTLARPAVKRRVQQVTGLAFIGFGLRLAVER
ncbi:LysE family translocator [Actinomadura madurae]|uniref:LysE family translocator n=1 Tax=Actinomadura madurae TaxID=1993 RepID=UPI002025DD41|nr:LysE family translocator [Actinomadura madurae]MCP9949108.1 LysE family translocator [Actinomadura madurae]MCP9965871.1 LysE family translocator [Actinomadura madurae]MCP9978350.1 LysE family translocator [Actinomadura madurae]MCQ0010129.1 LysE family translocator [Actinomadura madurae]MCQ0014556.1 LysE family translocator [Actinomadura madurae]